MSAHAAQACELQNSKRAPEAQPVTKLDAFDRVRALICDGERLHIDMNVVQCLGQITDKETGAARAELATIGKLARWGQGPGKAWSLATKYLDRRRDQSGDSRVVAAIERAKIGNGGSGWFGDYLIQRLGERLGDG